jgi:hypothetical protein
VRRLLRFLVLLVLVASVAACGGGDDDAVLGADDGRSGAQADDGDTGDASDTDADDGDADAAAEDGDEDGSGDADTDFGEGGAERGDGSGPLDADMATLRMINLVGVAEGGIDVDVVGPAEDITSDHVYGTVAYGEVAEIEFPEQWDARLKRAGTDEEVGGTFTVYDDTEPGRVVAFREEGASTFGAFVEDRKDGYATIGVVSAIDDPDPNRSYRPSNPDGVCLFSVGDEVPAPMATAAEGGDTRGILTLGLVSDFVWYIEPGPQVVTYGDSAEDVFEQGDDCTSFAFDAEIDAEAGKAVFVAFYGPSSDVRSTVYYEE